jgi:hypothetical protein
VKTKAAYAQLIQQCVDIPNAATTDGTPVNQHTCNGSVAQQFRLRTIA